jgi:AcrR family transcriptional regulator
VPRRNAADAAETRRAILDAARRRFGEDGYAATTTAAIATDAGVSQSGLFHHFPDKRHLFAEVLRETITAYDDEVRAAALAATRPLDIVLAGCRRSLELATDPSWARIVVTDAPVVLDEASMRELDAAMGRATTLFGLQFLVSTGDLDPSTDVEALATVIYGALTEAAFDLARRPSAVPTERVMAVVSTLIAAHGPAPEHGARARATQRIRAARVTERGRPPAADPSRRALPPTP